METLLDAHGSEVHADGSPRQRRGGRLKVRVVGAIVVPVADNKVTCREWRLSSFRVPTSTAWLTRTCSTPSGIRSGHSYWKRGS